MDMNDDGVYILPCHHVRVRGTGSGPIILPYHRRALAWAWLHVDVHGYGDSTNIRYVQTSNINMFVIFSLLTTGFDFI